MRRIESKKLTLHKETLRTLASAELSVVAGATGMICGSVVQLSNGQSDCPVTPPGDGNTSPSIAGFICHVNPLPDPSERINPSLVIGPGGG